MLMFCIWSLISFLLSLLPKNGRVHFNPSLTW